MNALARLSPLLDHPRLTAPAGYPLHEVNPRVRAAVYFRDELPQSLGSYMQVAAELGLPLYVPSAWAVAA